MGGRRRWRRRDLTGGRRHNTGTCIIERFIRYMVQHHTRGYCGHGQHQAWPRRKSRSHRASLGHSSLARVSHLIRWEARHTRHGRIVLKRGHLRWASGDASRTETASASYKWLALVPQFITKVGIILPLFRASICVNQLFHVPLVPILTCACQTTFEA